MDSNPRIPFLTAALATILAAMAPAPSPAASTDALLRCRAPDGSIGYTDRSCAVFGTQSVPIPGDLLARIAFDRAGTPDFDDARLEGAAPGPAAAPGRRSPASGCAHSPVQLATDIHAAVALGDVNRVAESYHFAGMSSDAGERTLDQLQRLVGRPVLDSRYFGDPIAGAGAGTVQLVLGDGDGSGASAVDFEVARYAGCYFVRFQGGMPGQRSNL